MERGSEGGKERVVRGGTVWKGEVRGEGEGGERRDCVERGSGREGEGGERRDCVERG